MSIRLNFIIISFTFFNSIGYSQDTCDYKGIRRIELAIEKSIFLTSDKYYGKDCENYIIDIKVNDSLGTINNIDYYGKKGYLNFKYIEEALILIKEIWKPLYCKIKRILIPVFFMYETDNIKNLDFVDYPFPIEASSIKNLLVAKPIIFPVVFKID